MPPPAPKAEARSIYPAPKQPRSRQPASKPSEPRDPTPQKPTRQRRSASRAQTEVASLRSQLDTPATDLRPSLWIRLASNWTLWALVALALFGGVATASAVSLFRIPNLPNCRAIFWPLASASTRLQCADAYADQGSVESLLAAISLVERLPQDHPLRSDIDERVERWAEQILTIADRTFHEGDLQEAIAIARRIPGHTAAAALVVDRIATWEDIWQKASTIFANAETYLQEGKFREAFGEAIQLRNVGNDYWQTTKYEELLNLITAARRDINLLGQARRLAERGSVTAILEALELIGQIQDTSPLHGEAQTLMKEISRKLLDLAENALARADSASALDILGKIPPKAGLAGEVADFKTLAEAYELTWDNSTMGYETAILRLQSISRDRPLYSRAQALIGEWQQQVEGLALLDWSRRVAEPGTVADLRAAIIEARRIGRDNPRWQDAQQQIDRWQREISRIEDGPYLSQAKALAGAGDRAALSAAIETAQVIPRGSSLYSEAQDLIADWRWEIQRLDHAPILAQARQLAAAGNFSQAIAVASQIPQGQALHSDAQSLVRTWRGEVSGGDQLQRAYQSAQGGTIAALVQAINIAREVPEGSSRWSEAQGVINQWSWDILRSAESEANRDLPQAIQIARQVPARTEAYASAQLKIQEWTALSNP